MRGRAVGWEDKYCKRGWWWGIEDRGDRGEVLLSGIEEDTEGVVVEELFKVVIEDKEGARWDELLI